MAAPGTIREALTDPAAGQPVEYPSSDGKVLMETDPHARSIIDMRDQLGTHFKAREDAYVTGSMAVYYRRGDPAAVMVPDAFVVLGAAHNEVRKSYPWFQRRRWPGGPGRAFRPERDRGG